MPYKNRGHASAWTHCFTAVPWRAAAVFCAAALGCGMAQADASVPWTPSVAARHRLELLVDEAGLALLLTQWPLPSAAVRRALDALPPELPIALALARDDVRRELQAQDHGEATLRLRGRDEALAGFGDDATPGTSIGVRTPTRAEPHWAVQLGARIDTADGLQQHGAQFRLDESAMAVEALDVQLQAWSHRDWWGPGWQNSLVLGNNAPPLNGIGLQRSSAAPAESRWLAWMGPWNIDLFIAQTDTPDHAYLVGNRLTLRPWPALEIGLTRTAQWGGNRHAQTMKSFVNMLLGVGVNANTPNQIANDPANEMSGFDLRLRCPGELRCAGYAQLMGEDATHGVPSRFLGLYGMESWSGDGQQRWFGEFAETLCGAFLEHHTLRACAYRNYAYPEGYTHALRWMGAAIGPDSRVLTLGWLDATRGTSLRLNAGRVGSRVGSFTPDPHDPQTSGRLVGVAARQDFQWGDAAVTAELDWLRVQALAGDLTEGRIGATLRFDLDGPARTSSGTLGNALSLSDGRRITPLLVGAGLIAGAALLDRPLDNYAREHGDNASTSALRKVGDAVPILGFGLAGASWLLQRGSVQGEVAFDAIEAGLGALAVAELTKMVVDRARPDAELGPASFGDVKHRADSSFPSVHSAFAWAVLTPYAEHYHEQWLYGLAALTETARVMGRHHWASDVVGGAVLGYWIGDLVYHRSDAADGRPRARLAIAPNAVVLNVPFE